MDPPDRVILVDEHDRPIGEAEKLEVHTGEGQRHRAFSVFLVDGDGRQLLQRRALGKYHFGGLWSNACCSHPRPGEDIARAAERRLREELGLSGLALEPVTRFEYKARDPASGLIEHEVDHVLVGRLDHDPTPERAEVEAFRWIRPAELDAELAAEPSAFTPWFPLALARLRDERPGLI